MSSERRQEGSVVKGGAGHGRPFALTQSERKPVEGTDGETFYRSVRLLCYKYGVWARAEAEPDTCVGAKQRALASVARAARPRCARLVLGSDKQG